MPGRDHTSTDLPWWQIVLGGVAFAAFAFAFFWVAFILALAVGP
jgi:hypothetical protein